MKTRSSYSCARPTAPTSPRRSIAGSTLAVTLTIVGIMSLILLSYLSMISNSHQLTARSQVWNSALAVAEAGAEEALAHLNMNGVNKTGQMFAGHNLLSQGWTAKSGGVYMRRPLGSGYYEVTITPGAKPVILSTGYVPAPASLTANPSPIFAIATPWESGNRFLSRTVKIVCRANGRFTKAIIGKDKVELNGKNVFVDSYNSYDPSKSTWDGTNATGGTYDPAKRSDAGDVAVIKGFKDVMKISKATVRGRVSTGPDGNVKIDKNALVGSLDWCDTHTSGVEPGWSADDANFDMPYAELPFTVGLPPAGGWVDTNYYDYILPTGDWELKSFKGSVLVTGNARILVTDKIEFSEDPKDDHGIELDPGARLEVYMTGKEAKLVGKKDKKKTSVKMYINGEGNPTNFLYFGMEKHTKLEIKNMDDFTGIVYAPNAEIKLKAGSLKYYHCNLHGAVMGEKVELEKNVTFHFDENIASLAADSYAIESWEEL